MHNCEHNEKMSLFCLSDHCEWKQPAGCDRCIKKYHNHITNQRVISEDELLSMSQKLSLENVAKPNSRKIQQYLYSYFTTLKTDFTSSLDLMCKTLINAIGSPYLSENQLLIVYKRIKHKQYKRLQHKEFKRFCETATKVNIADISKEQRKLYREQLKKSHKLLNGLEAVLTTYEGLFRQLNENFQRQKCPFEILMSILKQTIENADLSINLSQFHQREMEKNKAQRAEKQQKNNPNDSNKKSKNQYDSMLSTQYSSRLASVAKQKMAKTPQVHKTPSVSKTPTNLKQDIFYQSTTHKFGVKEFGTLQKLQKSDSQQMKTKRPLSLDKKFALNVSLQIPTNTQRKRSDYGFIQQIKNVQPDKVQRQKITFLQKHESILNDMSGESVIKRSQGMGLNLNDKSSLRENEISVRKEQLIEMMRSQVGKSGGERMGEKADTRVGNNNSVVVKNKGEEINNIEMNTRKNNSSFFADKYPRQEGKSQQKSPLFQPKPIQPPIDPNNSLLSTRPVTLKPPSQKPPLNQMPDIGQSLQKSSQGSLQVLKKIIPKKNMNAHPKLPIEQIQEKPKQLAQSRLIIVPTWEKFNVEKNGEQCDSPLLKKKVSGGGGKKDSNNTEKLAAKYLTKKQHSPQKPQIKQSQQKSLNLLIKSIHLPPSDAIPTLQSALHQSPNNLSAAEYLSFLYLQQQKPKEALLTCNSILDRFQIITKENEELLINLQNNKSAALNMLGRYSQAIVLLERCIKCKQKDTLLKNLGDAYYFNSNYQKAVFYYQKAVKISPHFDQAYYNMAVCLYLQNNFHNAHQAVVKALENAPKNNDYLQLKNNVQVKIKQVGGF